MEKIKIYFSLLNAQKGIFAMRDSSVIDDFRFTSSNTCESLKSFDIDDEEELDEVKEFINDIKSVMSDYGVKEYTINL